MPFLPLLAQSVTIPPDRPKVGETRRYVSEGVVDLTGEGFTQTLRLRQQWTVTRIATKATKPVQVTLECFAAYEDEPFGKKAITGSAEIGADGSWISSTYAAWTRFNRWNRFRLPTSLSLLVMSGRWKDPRSSIKNHLPIASSSDSKKPIR